MLTRRPLMAGNWKMNKTVAEAIGFISALNQKLEVIPEVNRPDIAIFPSFISLGPVYHAIHELSSSIMCGAQTMESKESGAYTGEVSPVMLRDLGVPMVVIGHSERRQYYNETDETVNQKTLAALQHHLTPVVCVGETLEQREAGETDSVITQQLKKALTNVPEADIAHLVVAYEPVWAIGTGKVCESEEANRVCGLIRHLLKEQGDGEATRVLYGGSVSPKNIDELIALPHIDGGLVGGASLEADSFFELIKACQPKQLGQPQNAH